MVNMLPPGGMPNMPGMDPEKMKEMQAAYQEAMKNPETAKKIQEQMKQMQGMMSNPMVQQQMQAMQNMVQNEDMQKRIAGAAKRDVQHGSRTQHLATQKVDLTNDHA